MSIVHKKRNSTSFAPKDELVQLLESQASTGSSEAVYSLGYYYMFSLTNLDFSKAVQYFEKAMQMDIVNAITMLGVCYYMGKGVKKDWKKATELLERANFLQDGKAKFFISIMYYYGHGVEKNRELAFKMFRSVNLPECEFWTGKLYFYGHGVGRNRVKGLELVENAANRGCGMARLFLYDCCVNGKGCTKDLKKAAGLVRLLKSTDDFDLLVVLCKRSFSHINYDEALPILESAAAGEYAGALTALACCLQNGLGIEKDRPAAETYFKRAADMLDPHALHCMGLRYSMCISCTLLFCRFRATGLCERYSVF